MLSSQCARAAQMSIAVSFFRHRFFPPPFFEGSRGEGTKQTLPEGKYAWKYLS